MVVKRRLDMLINIEKYFIPDTSQKVELPSGKCRL